MVACESINPSRRSPSERKNKHTETHTNAADSESNQQLPGSVLLRQLNHNCSWASPLSALVHLSQVANRQQPLWPASSNLSASEIKYNNSTKTRFIEIKDAGLVMWLCWSNHTLCVLARMTTCAAFLKKDYF